MDPFGNYVVQRALAIATHAQAIRLVEAMRPHLISSQPGAPNGQRNGGMRNTAGGRRIMAKICRRFPNFTLSGTMTLEELYSQNKSQRKSQHSAGTPFHQTTSPVLQHLSPLQQYGGYSLQGHHVARDDNTGPVRQPYYDARQGYYDHAQSGHPNYHTQMWASPRWTHNVFMVFCSKGYCESIVRIHAFVREYKVHHYRWVEKLSWTVTRLYQVPGRWCHHKNVHGSLWSGPTKKLDGDELGSNLYSDVSFITRNSQLLCYLVSCTILSPF